MDASWILLGRPGSTMTRIKVVVFLCLSLWLHVAAAETLVVASLNPIATDLIREVGGEDVDIIELMKPGQDPHAFLLRPEELQQAANAKLFFAMGKGLETYLPDLTDNLTEQQQIIEIGRTIPSLRLSKEDQLFTCCPAHAHGAIDPHWWHNPRQMERAARYTAKALAEADPDHASDYKKQASAYAKQMKALRKWADHEFARIPPENRKLTTSHTAFNYLCKEYGFQAIPVKGLTTRESENPEQLARVVDIIRSKQIPAVFPEAGTQQKVLIAIVRETGVRVGTPLLAGSPTPDNPTYEAMFRHNVTSIVHALTPEQ
jgi:zinc/manganese transport system substrate-binding protein